MRTNQLVFWSDKPEHVSLEDIYDEGDIKGAVRQMRTNLRYPAVAQPQPSIRLQEGRATQRERRRVIVCSGRG